MYSIPNADRFVAVESRACPNRRSARHDHPERSVVPPAASRCAIGIVRVQIQLERLTAYRTVQAAPAIHKMAHDIKRSSILAVPRSKTNSAVRTWEKIAADNVSKAADDHPSAPAVVVGLPTPCPHCRPLCSNRFYRS